MWACFCSDVYKKVNNRQ
jgi:hypothetical protein